MHLRGRLSAERKDVKICIASPDIVGPIANGGVGTACTALAQTLAAAGHSVTLFYTSTYLERGGVEQWKAFYAGFGVELMVLSKSALPPVHIAPTVYDEDNISRAYHVYQQLKERDFDLIHFVDYIGLGYFAALAKSQGLRFRDTTLVVTTHAPTLWSRLQNARPLDDISYLVRDRLERGLVQLCDLVISPSRYMLEWLRSQDWSLPEQQVVLPNLLPMKQQEASCAPRAPSTAPIKEIVFFGRLEPRKGLLIFCDAIDRLSDRLPPHVSISFLGKLSRDYPQDLLEARTGRWKRPVTFHTGFDTFEAVDYLKGEGRLAVLAALSDNSPYTVLECLSYRIPFISSNVGGVPELIDAPDHARTLFAPTPRDLAARLASVVEGPVGSFPPAKPAHDIAAVRQAHLALYDRLAEERAQQPASPAVASGKPPLVSVNILHFERPDGLQRALASIERQSYPNIEIVVVDNGSRGSAACTFLDRLEASGRPGLKVLRLGENLYEPSGRNAGAEISSGQYLLFMDDDNVAKPHEVEVFCRAAEQSGADILTCFNDHFATDAPPERDEEALKRFVVLGDCGPVGLLLNSYGDLNCFCRRDRFLEIGGFLVDGCFNHAEDWRFFAKAWSRGLRLAVVPEALIWYRTTGGAWGQGWRKRDRGGALLRAAQTYLEEAPPESAPFLYLAQGLFWKAVTAETSRRNLRNEVDDLRRDKERLAEALAQQNLASEVLLNNYRALAEFVSTALDQQPGQTPEMQRALMQIRRVAQKYR